MEFATNSWSELISLRPKDRDRLPLRGKCGEPVPEDRTDGQPTLRG